MAITNYICAKCCRNYSALEAPSLLDRKTGTFKCRYCKIELKEESIAQQVIYGFHACLDIDSK
jgi:hypothetical protein